MKRSIFGIGKSDKIKGSKFQIFKTCLIKQRIAILASICLVVLMIIVSVVVQYDTWFSTICQGTCNVSVSVSRSRITTKSSRCSCSTTQVTCTGASSTAEIDDELYNIDNCDATTLTITGSTFTTIPAEFIRQTSLSLTTLQIASGRLIEIEQGAFNSDTFINLRHLVIENNPLTYVRKDFFEGLSSLYSFSFRMVSFTVVKFERNLLAHIKTIAVLQFHNCVFSPEGLANITASDVNLSSLQNIDLRFNLIATLTARVFSKLGSVLLFNINNSGVERVEMNAFYGLNALQTLNISNNDLSTLPEGVFGIPVRNISIHNNPWTCDCDLEWLWELYNAGEVINRVIPSTCDNYDGLEFSQALFCPNPETEATTKTTSTTTITPNLNSTTSAIDIEITSTTTKDIGDTITPNLNTTTSAIDIEITSTTTKDIRDTITPNLNTTTTAIDIEITSTMKTTTVVDVGNMKQYKEIICRDWGKSPLCITEDLGDLIYTHTIYTENENFSFEFYDPDVDPVELIVFVTGNLTDSHLLWFNTHATNETGCITNISNAIVLNQLSRANTYTFCMLYDSCTVCSVSPFDCFGFEIRVEYAERAWIRNKYYALVIALTILFFLFGILMSAMIMYCCVRKYPVLIKGNKRVIIVGRRKPTESSTPKEYEKPVYTPPSIDSILSGVAQSTSGYTRIRRRHYRSPILRSLSEHSVFSGEVSYIRPPGPSSYQLNTWRLNSKDGRPILRGFEGSIYGPDPPPLPPPNRIEHVTWEENMYTTL